LFRFFRSFYFVVELNRTKAALPLTVQTFEVGQFDALRWQADFAFRAFDVRVGVRAQDASLLTHLTAHLPPHWRPMRRLRVDRRYSFATGNDETILYGDGAMLARATDIRLLFEIFESDSQRYIAEMSPRKIFIHAGVVGWRGRAIVMPGRSMSGKTTLVREFVRAGAVYYSDEYAVIDEQGRVHPFARPLAIRDENLRQRKVPVEALGGRAGKKPLPVGLVIVSKYQKRARGWHPQPLSAGRGALEILANAVAVRRQSERVLAALQKIVVGALVIKGRRGEARQVVEAVLKNFD
jgi:hypothetical protein